jgi:hypothetical protein
MNNVDSGESNKDNVKNILILFKLRLFLYQSYNYTILLYMLPVVCVAV